MLPCGLASFRGLGLLARLAKVAGMTVYSIRNAADKMGDMNATARKRKTLASVFGPPRKLGFFSIQYIGYEPPLRRWYTEDGCLYEGVLTPEGCRRGVCMRLTTSLVKAC